MCTKIGPIKIPLTIMILYDNTTGLYIYIYIYIYIPHRFEEAPSKNNEVYIYRVL